MIKRPLTAAAVVLVTAAVLILRLYPSLIKPSLAFSDFQSIEVSGTVDTIEKYSGKVRLILSAVTVSENSGTEQGQPGIPEGTRQKLPGKAILFLTESAFETAGIRIGNGVLAECSYRKMQTARNDGNFHEEQYYYSRGIFLKADGSSVRITDAGEHVLRQFLFEVHSRMVSGIFSAVPDEETAGILAAICTGDRNYLSDESRQMYQRSGIAHILAVSGLHISLLGFGIFRVLRKRCRFFPAAAAAAIFMIGFCIMSDASPSSVRALIMFLVQLVSIGSGKTYDMRCALSLAAVLMLADNLLLLENTAFQLSFAAILSVNILYPSFRIFLSPRRKEGNHKKKKSRQLFQKAAEAFLMSASVTLGTLPLTAGIYYELPLYSVLLNLLVVPLMSLVLGTGVLTGIFGMLSLVISRFFAGAGVYLVQFISWTCRICESLPGNRIITGHPDPIRVWIYYGLLLLLAFAARIYSRILAFQQIDPYGRRYQSKKHRSHSAVFPLPAILFFCAGLLLLLFHGHAGTLRIQCMDVGQGECILLESPDGHVYLLDGGSSSESQAARYRISGALKYNGISEIDYSIITHPDSDHLNGILEILEDMQTAGNGPGQAGSMGIRIRRILIPFVPENTNYQRLVDLAIQKQVEVIPLHSGMSISDGSLQMFCLHPDASCHSEEANDYSAVIRLVYGDFSALFTGDLEEEGEQLLIRNCPELIQDYDLLKVAHHGSRNSSADSFLQAVSPKAALISAGVHNSYGHPHPETLEKLQRIGTAVFCTADFGEITVDAYPDGSMKIRTKSGTGTKGSRRF